MLKLQNSARNSTEWFETLERYLHFEPIQFAYSLLTRSQRVSHENLRLRDKPWLEGVERWFQSKALGRSGQRPRAADVRALPAARRSASTTGSSSRRWRCIRPEDGVPNDFHLVHYGTRAQGGAGLVYTEMTCVSAEGRITPGCAGLYAPEHVEAWRRIVDFVHSNTRAKFCLQLGHSGPKGSTRVGWEGYDVPLESGNWPVMAASDVPWSERQPGAAADDPRRHGRGARAVRRLGADGPGGGVRHGRAPRRPRLSPLQLHHAADQQAHGRIWRQPGEPPALPAGDIPGDAGGLAGRQADVGANLRQRLDGRARA